MWNGVDFAVHQEFLVRSEFHDNNAEVSSAQIEGQELSVFLSIWQASDVSGKTFDT